MYTFNVLHWRKKPSDSFSAFSLQPVISSCFQYSKPMEKRKSLRHFKKSDTLSNQINNLWFLWNYCNISSFQCSSFNIVSLFKWIKLIPTFTHNNKNIESNCDLWRCICFPQFINAIAIISCLSNFIFMKMTLRLRSRNILSLLLNHHIHLHMNLRSQFINSYWKKTMVVLTKKKPHNTQWEVLESWMTTYILKDWNFLLNWQNRLQWADKRLRCGEPQTASKLRSI